LGHQTQLRAIKSGFREAIALLQPDLLLLNEYVHDDELRASMMADLRLMGLGPPLVSDQVNRPPSNPGEEPLRNNQIFAAARAPLRRGDLHGPTTADNGGVTNFLHVHAEGVPFEIVGLLVPGYKGAELKAYWEAFATLAGEVSSRRILFVGDFNDDPDQAQTVGGGTLASLRGTGWQLPRAEGAWSFKTGTRIDHALASSSMPKMSARYVSHEKNIILAGKESDAISDHAALVVDIDSPLGVS
jgi:hypothetical protein